MSELDLDLQRYRALQGMGRSAMLIGLFRRRLSTRPTSKPHVVEQRLAVGVTPPNSYSLLLVVCIAFVHLDLELLPCDPHIATS